MKNLDAMVMESASNASESITKSYKDMEIETDLRPEAEITTEVWKKVSGCSTYEVSSLGRVKALNFQNKGYEVVIAPREICNSLYFSAVDDNGKRKNLKVADAVATAFIPNPDKTKLKYVQFKDGDASNCNVTNLYWRSKKIVKTKSVFVYNNDGTLFKTFKSASDAACYFECPVNTVYNCCYTNEIWQGVRMSYELKSEETFGKLHNSVVCEKTLPFFNFKTLHKTYGCEDLTISIDSKCKSFKKITTGSRAEAGHAKVKRDKNDMITEASLKLDGFKGKKASVEFVLQKDESYEIVINYPNGASLMVARCKYSFSSQSELLVCAEALDSLYRKIVAEEEGNVKDVYIEEFKIGRMVKGKAA